MLSLKPFIYAFAFTIFAIFALNVVCDPFGLINPSADEFLNKNPRHCAVDDSLFPEGAQNKLKTLILDKTNPSNIVIGSSRVLKVRRFDFNAGGFVSFSFSALGSDSYAGIGRLLRGHPSVKYALLGIEFYSFGRKTLSIKLIDKALSFFSSLGLRQSFLEFGFFLYELRGSPHFRNKGVAAWYIATEYLSLPATIHSFQKIWRQLTIGSNMYQIELAKNSVVPSRCVLYHAPEIMKAGAWDMDDGSTYTSHELSGVILPGEFREYNPEYFSGGYDISNHWNLVAGFDGFSEFKLAVLEKFLSELKNHGIRVIGFTPPFPHRVMEGYRQIGVMVFWDEFNRRMGSLFAKYDDQFIVQSVEKLKCDDFKDFDDPWHPSRECMKNALLDIHQKEKWPMLRGK